MSTDNQLRESTYTRVSKGLTVPIAGGPDATIVDGPPINTVGLVADDYLGMKPTMMVTEGDVVKRGQALFEDKKTPGVLHTSPTSGRVIGVHRGEKRRFLAIDIAVEGDDAETFPSYADHYLYNLEREQVIDNLLKSGLWAALRTRPYSRVPAPESRPAAIFVTAIDTNPLAPDPLVVLNDRDNGTRFIHGLQVLSTLTDDLILCHAAGEDVPGAGEKCCRTAEFEGPHPAGLVGTHIHCVMPVNENRTVWHIGYQDVIAIGHLFVSGELKTERIVSVGGPAVKEPALVRTTLGASLADLTHNNIESGELRIISGSVLGGRQATAPGNYLGRFHNQVSVLGEGRERELLGWITPGFNKFSIVPAFASALLGLSKSLPMTTSTQGSRRAVVPIGAYERVMPLDLVITPLLKSLLVHDTETAQMLGCLELDEEDLSLCTFVCPGKNDYGVLLREILDHIEREG